MPGQRGGTQCSHRSHTGRYLVCRLKHFQLHVYFIRFYTKTSKHHTTWKFTFSVYRIYILSSHFFNKLCSCVALFQKPLLLNFAMRLLKFSEFWQDHKVGASYDRKQRLKHRRNWRRAQLKYRNAALKHHFPVHLLPPRSYKDSHKIRLNSASFIPKAHAGLNCWLLYLPTHSVPVDKPLMNSAQGSVVSWFLLIPQTLTKLCRNL